MEKSWNVGKWRITSMTEWDNDFIDEEVLGYFNFAKNGLCDFQFGYVRCDIDWREGILRVGTDNAEQRANYLNVRSSQC